MNKTLKEGEQLPSERELAEQFHVSRVVVREAMRVLAQEGLVKVQPGRGVFVSSNISKAMENLLDLGMRRGSARRWSHLLEVRDLLEPGIAAIAAERATKEDIAAMSEAIAAMDASSGDTDTYISGDDQFHLMLAKGTQNELVLNILEPILGLLHDQREGITRLPGVVEEGQYHHKRILNAIMSHDPESAREAMRDHLAQVRRLIAKTNPRSE